MRMLPLPGRGIAKWTSYGRSERKSNPFLWAGTVPRGMAHPLADYISTLAGHLSYATLVLCSYPKECHSFSFNASKITKNDLAFLFASFLDSSLKHWLCPSFPFCPLRTGHPTFPSLTFIRCKIRILMNIYLQRI